MQLKRALVMLLTMVVVSTNLMAASKFRFTCHIDNNPNPTLSFGIDEEETIIGFPPSSPSGVNAYFLGGLGNDDSFYNGQRIGEYILKADDDLKAVTWTFFVESQDCSVTFNLENGNLANTDILRIIAESGTDFETTDITHGVTVSFKEGNNYYIQYAETEADVVPAAPDSIEVQMLKSIGETKTVTMAKTIPEGWKPVLVETPKAYEIISAEIGTKAEEIDNHGITVTINDDGNVDITLGDSVDKIDFFTFQYALEKDGVKTLPGTMLVELTDGIAAELKEGKNYFDIEPSDESPANVELSYALEISSNYQSNQATLKLSFPSWTTQDETPFPYTATVKLGGVEITKTDAGTAHEPEYEFTLPQKAEDTLVIDLTVAAKAESGPVYASIVVGYEEFNLTPVRINIKGTGTLDFDGDGEITLNDAMLLYNFVRRGYPDADDRRFTDSIKLAFTEGTTIEQANAAMDYFRANGNTLNLLGNENGLPNMNDVMLIYNFVRRGCPDEDDRRFTDTIKLAFTSDLTIEDANEAYKIIRSFAENVK